MIDYELIIRTLIQHIKSINSGVTVIESGDTGDQPDYPFVTYTITSPYIPSAKAISVEKTTEDIDVVISLTWVDLNSFKAMSLAQQTASSFNQQATIQKFDDKALTIVRVGNASGRDNFISIEVERRSGFDLRLRTRITTLNAGFDQIENIGVSGR